MSPHLDKHQVNISAYQLVQASTDTLAVTHYAVLVHNSAALSFQTHAGLFSPQQTPGQHLC
jgi:hypothetical protein